jgi:predicted dehydrogenase
MTLNPPFQVAVVGVGKIARDQHMPSIRRSTDFRLAAAVSRNAAVENVDSFDSMEELFQQRPDIRVVSLCTPPQARYDLAIDALRQGRHVLLEKPPGATLGEIETMVEAAKSSGCSLFATWHSRFAPAVELARRWLLSRSIETVKVTWKEDVRYWHPGQKWIWEAGGLGVFDPGINALSILTAILPFPVHVASAKLEVPVNCQTPIAADLVFAGRNDASIEAAFDFRQTGPQIWDIDITTTNGTLKLSKGGSVMGVDGVVVREMPEAEYDGIYARFSELLRTSASEVDTAPLRIVADAFLLGERIPADPFVE